MKRLVGVVIAFLLLGMTFVPATALTVTAQKSSSVAALQELPPPGEEGGGLVADVLESLLVAGGAKKSGFPYECLDTVLSVTIPPLEPVFIPLSLLLGDLLNMLNIVLDNPEATGKLVLMALDILGQNPYGVVNLLDLILSPLSLYILNPLTWPQNPTLKTLCSGLEPQDICLNPVGFCQACEGNLAGYLAAWLSGLGVIGLVPQLIGMIESD